MRLLEDLSLLGTEDGFELPPFPLPYGVAWFQAGEDACGLFILVYKVHQLLKGLLS